MTEIFSNKQKEFKENIGSLPDLIIFDMDGTIVDEPEFYRNIYSSSLTQVVKEERGQLGIETLNFCRQTYKGKGELALFALGIPFRKWAEKLIAAPVNQITPQPDIVKRLRTLKTRKIIFTGSPLEMAYKLLEQFGFNPSNDFDGIMGWKEPEVFPLKWACSPFIFNSICDRFDSTPEDTWSVGDNWETDLEPAQTIGIKTIQIKKTTGAPNNRFYDLKDFLSYVN